MRLEGLLPASATELPTAKYVFAALVALLVAIAGGHWYLLSGRTDLYLGVPLWLWLQIVVVAVMLVLAWVAVTVWTAANDVSTARGSGRERGEEW